MEKRESRFNLGLNATKNSYYIEKFFKQKLSKIKLYKKFRVCISLSPPGIEIGGAKHLPFLKYNALEWGWQIFEAPSSTTGRRRDMPSLSFFIENSDNFC